MPQLTDQDVIKALRSGGPQVLNDLRKTLKVDSFVVGATLSTLLQKKIVKQTHHKKGTSCYYYLPGQEQFLEKLTSELNAKDQPTVAMLKSKQVIRDRDLELFERVSLRNIKDFAKEVVAQVPGGQILFWRYYLIPESKAIDIIKERYWHQKEEASQETKKEEPEQQEKPEAKQQPVEEKPVQTTGPRAVKQNSTDETLVSKEPQQESTSQKDRQKEVSEEPKTKPAQSSTPKQKESQQSLPEQLEDIEHTEFFDTILNYFKEKNISLISQEQLTKGKEYAFIVDVPSPVGTLRMYVRARNKKKLNEGDLAPALLKAKQLDQQLLFLTNGQFTKKGLKLIEQEYK